MSWILRIRILKGLATYCSKTEISCNFSYIAIWSHMGVKHSFSKLCKNIAISLWKNCNFIASNWEIASMRSLLRVTRSIVRNTQMHSTTRRYLSVYIGNIAQRFRLKYVGSHYTSIHTAGSATLWMKVLDSLLTHVKFLVHGVEFFRIYLQWVFYPLLCSTCLLFPARWIYGYFFFLNFSIREIILFDVGISIIF